MTILVQLLFGRLVPGTTSLLLLRLLLQLRRYSSLILFFKHIKFVMNIITFTFLMFITDGYYPSVITFRRPYRRIISVGITQRVATKLQAMSYIPTENPSVMPSVITLKITDGLAVGNVPARNFFWHAYPSVLPSVFPSVDGFFYLRQN